MLLRVALVASMIVTTSSAAAEPKRKDPRVAAGLSLGVTAAGAGALYLAFAHQKSVMSGFEAILLGLGSQTLLFGPSAGHVYAGEKRRAVRMYGLRIGASLLFLGGWFEWNAEGPPGAGKAEMWIGGTAWAALMMVDFIDAPFAARRANQPPEPPRFMPTLTTIGNRRVPGIAFAGTF